jgi:hypothetical protein
VGKYGNFIVETRGILQQYRSSNVGHVQRDGNVAAHMLARFTVSCQLNQVWFDYIPSCILGVVNAELIVADHL